MQKKWMKLWEEERDEAVKSCDVEKFRAFYNKWKVRGFYGAPLTQDDSVIEITMRKIICHLGSATEEEKQAAKAWLEERGFDGELS